MKLQFLKATEERVGERREGVQESVWSKSNTESVKVTVVSLADSCAATRQAVSVERVKQLMVALLTARVDDERSLNIGTCKAERGEDVNKEEVKVRVLPENRSSIHSISGA